MTMTFCKRLMAAMIVAVSATPLAPGHAEDNGGAKTVAALPAIPADHDSDIKFYAPGGAITTGSAALAQMPRAGLILWLAGNQFFAMDELVVAFQAQNPAIGVGLLTLPPGLLVQAIKAGGWTYDGREARGRPDIYASVNLGHLQSLKQAGLMSHSLTYMHNELQILVAKGNPKKIAGIGDLVRPDVRTSLPNPVNEGIMQFYLRKVLERHGLWQAISAGQACAGCQTTPNNWFTAVHHRETPARIAAGQSDAGVVWRTEALQAARTGAQVDAVELPKQDSLRDDVAYAIGVLNDTPHAAAAKAYLDFIGSQAGQDIYRKYGFVGATADELKPRPIE